MAKKFRIELTIPRKILWVLGRADVETPRGYVWDICGVFDTEAAAVAGCTTERHFVGPIPLNVRLPDQTEPWPGAYSPMDRAAASVPE